MRQLDDSIRHIQLARVPEHAELRSVLRSLAQTISSLSTVQLSYLELIKLALLMKEIEKNCYALRLEAELVISDRSLEHQQNELAVLRITGLVALQALINDAGILATQDNSDHTPVVLSSSKHPGYTCNQSCILLKILRMINANMGLLNVLITHTPDQKARLEIALTLLPSERDFYYFIAVSRSEYTGN